MSGILKALIAKNRRPCIVKKKTISVRTSSMRVVNKFGYKYCTEINNFFGTLRVVATLMTRLKPNHYTNFL